MDLAVPLKNRLLQWSNRATILSNLKTVGSSVKTITIMDDDEEDDQINVKSENFVPLRAIYSKKLIIPYPSAPVLDNVAKANALLARQKNLDEKIVEPKRVKEDELPSTSKNQIGKDDIKKGMDKEPKKNVLTQMSETTKGPLAFLKTCMDKRIRVKVWTRGASEIRGYCLGFVAAFDKHWNLAMEDVQEKWTRKVKRKTYLIGRAHEPPLGWKAMGPMVKPPKVIVSAVENGKEICERHVNQMLIRGEQIAFISVSGI